MKVRIGLACHNLDDFPRGCFGQKMICAPLWHLTPMSPLPLLKQYGSTFQLTMGQLVAHVVDMGVDDCNLGQWAWTQFKGWHGQSTRIILVYVPCCSAGEETVYKQHCHHLHKQGILECPCSVLLRDLKWQLFTWQEAGDQLVVFLDANKDMMVGLFYDMLTGNGLHMQEAV
jgi:hypothetical protein